VTARLRAPGLHRGILAVIPGIGFAYALIIVIRAASGLHHIVDGTAILQVAMISSPFAFLIGWARSTTGSTGRSGARHARRTTQATARARGRTTSASTPTTR